MRASKWSTSRAKRTADFILAAVAMLPALPILLAASAWSAIAYRANPVLSQVRVGQGGKKIRVFKVRTLPVDTPSNIGRDELNESFTPSATARLVRTTHLDELPQLWNVLRGEMSIVGPRPMIVPIVDGLHPDFAKIRHAVKPGLTGLWQISDRGSRQLLPFDELDVTYVATASPVLDLKTSLFTFAQMLGIAKPKHADDLIDHEVVGEHHEAFYGLCDATDPTPVAHIAPAEASAAAASEALSTAQTAHTA